MEEFLSIASGLSFGRWAQTAPPRIEHDIDALIKRVAVHAANEDLAQRGPADVALVEGVRRLRVRLLPDLPAGCDRGWHW